MSWDDRFEEFFPSEKPKLALGPGFYTDISHDAYHADPVMVPSLSSSVAALLASKAPLHAWARHPRLGGAGGGSGTKATDRGTIIHKLLLGRGQDFVEIEAEDYKSKHAQYLKKTTIEDGKIPLLSADLVEYTRMADIYRDRLLKLDPPIEFKGGQAELTMVWEERNGVLCRGRLDYWREEELLIDDVKTCLSCAPDEVASSMVKYHTDIQGAAYPGGVGKLIPEAEGRVRMRFIYMEAAYPFDVVSYEPDGTMQELGARRWKRGVDRWEAHQSIKGEWPGHSRTPLRLAAPAWALHRDLDSEVATMGSSTDVDF